MRWYSWPHRWEYHTHEGKITVAPVAGGPCGGGGRGGGGGGGGDDAAGEAPFADADVVKPAPLPLGRSPPTSGD